MTLKEPLALDMRTGLPDSLRILVETYPREDWAAHGNFGQMVQFWLQRHLMFRQLRDLLRSEARALADGRMAFDAYAPRLSHYGGMMLNELHGHHNIEDQHYFPRLVRLEPRLERGFDLLESDHAAMDGLIHDLAGAANAVLNGGPAGAFLEALDRFGALLDRHLTDEEEIIVPVILHTGFDG